MIAPPDYRSMDPDIDQDLPPPQEYALRIPDFMAYRTPQILQKFIESGRVAQMQVWGV